MEKIYFIFVLLLFSVNVFDQTIHDPDADMIFLDGKPDKKKTNEQGITPNYVIIGNGNNVWENRIITYFFANGTPDIDGTLEQDGVRDAFDIWEAEADIAFLEVCNANDADIVISWGSWNHGDGIPFDGPNGVYAHTLIGDPNTTYQWTTATQNGASSFYPSGNTAYLTLSGGASRTVVCTVTTPCGQTSVTFNCYNYSSSLDVVAYPNPASDEFHIEMTPSEKQGAEANSTPYEIKLFGPTGNELYSQTTSETKLTLNVRHLDNGFYYIHILPRDGIIRKKIRVER